MSAKQEEASSRGQRSKTTGSPNLIGPWPMSWPAAPCGPGATTKSSAVQPCSAKTRRIAALTRSTVSGSPSSQSTPSPFSACRISETPAASPASAARWARRMPSSSAPALTRRRASNTALIDRQLDAVAPDPVEVAGRERVGHGGVRQPCVGDGTGCPFVAHLEQAETLRVQLVDPDLLERMHGDVARDAADPRHLHRADVDVPGAVALEIDERDREPRAAPRGGAPASETCRR